jgi:hypothetical protein
MLACQICIVMADAQGVGGSLRSDLCVLLSAVLAAAYYVLLSTLLLPALSDSLSPESN